MVRPPLQSAGVKGGQVSDAEPFRLRIADDDPENRRVLTSMLQPKGYALRVAADGRRALASMEATTPDLVLLDIHMPELDGYGTFERMKASPALADTPVIFLTGLSEAFHKVKAFEMGAADYICKPFEAQEVLARVSLQLRLVSATRSLRQRNRSLELANAQLEQHQRFRQMLTQMLVHDMRSPLGALLCTFELIDQTCELTADLAELMHNARASTEQLNLLVSSLLDISRAQVGALRPELAHRSPADLVDRALHVLSGLTRCRAVTATLPDHLPDVCCDPQLIERVLLNLLDNALKHTPEDQPVTIDLEAREQAVVFRVSDRGPGIPVEERDRIFDLFVRLDASCSRRPSTGLGLAFCKLAIEAHGQTIHVEERDGAGVIFSFSLPTASACTHAHDGGGDVLTVNPAGAQ